MAVKTAKAKATKAKAGRGRKASTRAHKAQVTASKKRMTEAMRTGERTLTIKRSSAETESFKNRLDGVLRDPVLWNGVAVSYVKQVSIGEQGYDPNAKMVLIQDKDGHQNVVPIEEISDLYIPPVHAVERPRNFPWHSDAKHLECLRLC
jgi:hypothetical protein